MENYMNKIIENLEKNMVSDNVLFDIYGVSDQEHFDCMFIAPRWTPDKVFDINTVDIKQMSSNMDATTFQINHNGKKYLFIKLEIGAPNIADFCLSCYRANCDKFVFLGSAGALVPGIKIGDIIIPEYAISGNGATLYLHDRLNSQHLFEHVYSTQKLNEQIINICNEQNINVLNAPVISIDSLIAEYAHLDEFRAMGAQLIEMEVATFFACMNTINKNASAILVIADNSASGEHLIGRPEEDKKHYHNIRGQIGNVLLKL